MVGSGFDVCLPKKSIHHGEHIRAGLNQGVGIVEGNTADSRHGNIKFSLCALQQAGIHLRGMRFCAGGEKAAEGDVIGTLHGGFLSQLKMVVAGDADDGLLA